MLHRGYRALQGATGFYKGIKRVTGCYSGLQGVRGSYKGLQGFSKDYKGFQMVTETFFLARTSLDILSWFILHKNQS